MTRTWRIRRSSSRYGESIVTLRDTSKKKYVPNEPISRSCFIKKTLADGRRAYGSLPVLEYHRRASCAQALALDRRLLRFHRPRATQPSSSTSLFDITAVSTAWRVGREQTRVRYPVPGCRPRCSAPHQRMGNRLNE